MSDGTAPLEAPEVVYCARHPDVETGLRCGRCDTPICPQCMVMTPVGARCPDCARLRRLPTFDVQPQHYARAVAAMVAVAGVIGFVWSLLPFGRGAIFLLALIAGLAAGEAVSRATNRKRSRGLKAIAAAGAPLAFWVAVWMTAGAAAGLLGSLLLVVNLAFSNLLLLLGLAFGAYVATTRIDH